MTETAMSAQAAAAEIGRLENLRGPLERRTNGVTWMIWGIVTAGMFVSYDYIGVVVDAIEPNAVYLFSVLWMPWVAMGVVATAYLYRSVGLVFPGINVGGARRGWVTGGLFMVASLGAGSMLNFMEAPLVEPAMFLGVVGIVVTALGLTGIAGSKSVERRAQVVGGAIIIMSALPGFAIADRNLAYAVYGLGAPLIVVVVYFTIGVFLSRRG